MAINQCSSPIIRFRLGRKGWENFRSGLQILSTWGWPRVGVVLLWTRFIERYSNLSVSSLVPKARRNHVDHGFLYPLIAPAKQALLVYSLCITAPPAGETFHTTLESSLKEAPLGEIRTHGQLSPSAVFRDRAFQYPNFPKAGNKIFVPITERNE